MHRLLAAVALLTVLAVPAMACGPNPSANAVPIPPLAASLDEELATAKLPAARLQEVKALRAKITRLAKARKMDKAREVEEQAMALLGYSKAWLRCGPGTFMWMKLPSKTS